MFLKDIVNLNRRISFNYDILKKYEVGIVLFGWEIHSIRLHSINIINSYVKIKNFECLLVKSFVKLCNISFSNFEVLESRDRKLLLHKKEIDNLIGLLKIKSYTLVPSKVYWKNNFIKLEISLCIGKKTYDKRRALKNKEWNLDKSKILKSNVYGF